MNYQTLLVETEYSNLFGFSIFEYENKLYSVDEIDSFAQILKDENFLEYSNNIIHFRKNNTSKKFKFYHLYFVSKREIHKNDFCFFYNSLSKVLEIQNPEDSYEEQSAEIISYVKVTDEDKKFLKTTKDFSTMKHGFSLKQLFKVEASTNKLLDGYPTITKQYIEEYAKKPEKHIKAYPYMIEY